MLRLVGLQSRVIGALMMREVHTRYGRENIGFFWLIGEPAIFCLGVAVMWTAIRPAHEHGIPVTAFVITGYVPLTMWRHCVSRSVKAFEANGSLLFHRQVTPLDIIISRNILEIYGALIAGVSISIGAMLLGFMSLPADFGMLYVGLMYTAWFAVNSALILSALSEMSEVIDKFIGAVTYLAIPFSGSFTMTDWVPHSFQKILLWSPMVHGLEMIRQGMFGSTVHAMYSFEYATASNALLSMIGLSLVLRARKHILVQ